MKNSNKIKKEKAKERFYAGNNHSVLQIKEHGRLDSVQLRSEKSKIKTITTKAPNSSCLRYKLQGRLAGSVGTACDSWSQDFKFEPRVVCGDYLKNYSFKKRYKIHRLNNGN